MRSVMSHSFSRVPETSIKVSTFDRSHGVKTAFNAGELIPIFVDEILPGDTVDINPEFFGRLSTPVVPVLDNLFFETQWFFVASRLCWNNFTKMMGERVNPRDSIDYICPVIGQEEGFKSGSLADYFGIPVGKELLVNELPFRAYAKIWDDWYRAEQIQDSIIQSSDMLGDDNTYIHTNGEFRPDSGNKTYNWNTILKRGKRHDYFTSALPTPQLGEGVEIPLGSTAPVNFVGENGISTSLVSDSINVTGVGNIGSGTVRTQVNGSNTSLGDGNFVADLSAATPVTINSLRSAFQIQALLEADARSGGNRYIEILAQHFKTICPDLQLNRSEYLGGTSDLIRFESVPQTSSTNETSPQGNLASYALVSGKGRIVKSFAEHGYLIGIASVRADLNYQQGLNRLWSRSSRFDYYWPLLANLGEQAVLNKEIYAQGYNVLDDANNVIDDQPFGYQERYAEYRYKPSIITGKLRSGVDGSLDVWHLAQYFDSLPTLSPEWIEDSPPLNRVLAVTDEPQVILDAYIGYKHTRPMPAYSVPLQLARI